MPFTLAHPAIVLPLMRSNVRYLSGTALVAGSLAPDFDYFLKMSEDGQHHHSIGSLFYLDIPIALLLAVLFHEVMKKNLLSNLPEFFQRRFAQMQRVDFWMSVKRHPFVLVFSTAIGCLSHLLWDGFTHPGSFFVEHLSLYEAAVPYDGITYPLYYALQTISSFVGLGIILLFVFFMKPDPAAQVMRPRFGYWLITAGLTGIIVFVRFSAGHTILNFENLVVSFISASCCSFLVTGPIKFNARAID